MTWEEAYQSGLSQLRKAGIEEAELDSWHLFQHVTGVDRAIYYMKKDKLLAPEQEERYFRLLNECATGVPVQYLIGVWEFMGLDFEISPEVLIPRQDTETLVIHAEKVLASIGKQSSKEIADLKLLDMCTGSGCILISLMKRKGVRLGVGVDISSKALAVAGRNAAFHQVEAEFVESDLFHGVEGTFHLIVSNPPYIESAEIALLDAKVHDFEPRLALDGGRDGLDYYRRIVEESPDYLVAGGSLILEIGAGQGGAVTALMAERGFTKIAVLQDLSGLDRVVSGVYNI